MVCSLPEGSLAAKCRANKCIVCVNICITCLVHIYYIWHPGYRGPASDVARLAWHLVVKYLPGSSPGDKSNWQDRNTSSQDRRPHNFLHIFGAMYCFNRHIDYKLFKFLYVTARVIFIQMDQMRQSEPRWPSHFSTCWGFLSTFNFSIWQHPHIHTITPLLVLCVLPMQSLCGARHYAT